MNRPSDHPHTAPPEILTKPQFDRGDRLRHIHTGDVGTVHGWHWADGEWIYHVWTDGMPDDVDYRPFLEISSRLVETAGDVRRREHRELGELVEREEAAPNSYGEPPARVIRACGFGKSTIEQMRRDDEAMLASARKVSVAEVRAQILAERRAAEDACKRAEQRSVGAELPAVGVDLTGIDDRLRPLGPMVRTGPINFTQLWGIPHAEIDPRDRTAPHGDPLAEDPRPRYFEGGDEQTHILARIGPPAPIFTAPNTTDAPLTEEEFWRQVRAVYDRHRQSWGAAENGMGC